jgi:hypothetical protein
MLSIGLRVVIVVSVEQQVIPSQRA